MSETPLEDIEKLITESGNNFHCKVARFFKEKEWNILISPYYMDNATNKPREIDLIVEKAWRYSGSSFNQRYGYINIKLFIECKYIPQPHVFWFAEKDIVAARKWVTSNTPLREDNIFLEHHHYVDENSKVAKLFASKNRPKIENEVIYKALNQSLNAMVYLRRKESLIREIREREIPILATVEMPVILCNSFDNLYRVEMDEGGNPIIINENFQIEVNYAYIDMNKNDRTEYFLIDVVDFNKLDRFLEDIEDDKNAIMQII